MDLRAKPTGNGTDREWLELREGKPAAAQSAAAPTPSAASSVMVDDGNMLVSLSGSEVHHALFLSSVSHAHPLRFVSLKPPFTFPRAKPSRASYEGYTADGLLRSHWVVKHKFVIPSLVLVFVDWADAAPYEAQEMAACMRLAKVRGELQLRETRIALLVAKTTRFASAEEEAQLMDRLTRGIKRAGIEQAAHRTVLAFITVDAKPSVKRLEPFVYELSLDYYRTAVRRLRGLKSRISRTSQSLLYVRHQVKVGYFSEAIKDVPAAIKHYSHAYNALSQFVSGLPQTGLASPLAHELKQVGLVINHRLCRLLLQQSKWSEAIDQFNAHVAVLKRCAGLPDLLFSHYQWLSQQFHLFGDLLEQSGYHTSQRSKQLHSGYFYQTAATYAMKRKTYAQLVLHRLKVGSLSLPALVPPATLAPSAHLGQARLPYSAVVDDPRGVAGFSSFVVSTDPSDLVRSVVSLEVGVDHSAQIIGLLNKSYDRYKREHSERMIVHVASQIAAEYFSARNWLMAQRFFDRIATMYREEQWWMILTSTLMTSYHCAKEMGRHRETLQYAMELLGRYATTTTEQKERIHLHMLHLLSTAPKEGGLEEEEPPLVLDVPLKYRLIECDAVFLTTPVSVVYVQQSLDLVLVLDYHFPLPVTCLLIQFQFNHPEYHLTLQHDGSPPPDANHGDETQQTDTSSTSPVPLVASSDGLVVTRLHFVPNRTLTLHVKLPASVAPSSPLSLVHLVSHVLLGPADGVRVLRLRSWPNRREDEEALQPVYGIPPVITVEDAAAAKKKKKKKDPRQTAQEKEEAEHKAEAERDARTRALSTKLGAVSIVPPPPAVRMQVSHPSPPLLHEYFPLRLTLHTNGDDLTEGTLRLTAVNADEAVQVQSHAVEGLAAQQLGDGAGTGGGEEKKEESKEEHTARPSSHASPQTADSDGEVARFYTVRGATSSSPASVLLSSQLEELTSALSLPRVQPQSTHEVTVYLRLSSPSPHHVTIALSYTNGKTKFLQSFSQRLTLTARPPLSLKLKLFSDGSPPSTAPQPLSQTHQLAVHHRVSLHVELDNSSPHTLALTQLSLTLPKSAFDLEDPSMLAVGTQEQAGKDGFLDASSRYLSRHTSNAVLPSSASSSASPLSSPCVLLASGERYIHIFYFTPLTAGRVLSSSIQLLYCRVMVPPSVLAAAAALPVAAAAAHDSRSAGHALSEKQRDDLLKRLVEEQKLRAAGGGTAATSGLSTLPEASDSAPSVPSPSSSAAPHPVSSDSGVSAALQRELKVAEEEEAAAAEKASSLRDGTDAESVTITKGAIAATPTAASASSAAATASSALFPSIPVQWSHALPSLHVSAPPVHVEVAHPTVLTFGEAFTLSINLQNQTEHLHSIRFTCTMPHLASGVGGDGGEGGTNAGSTSGTPSNATPSATSALLPPPRLLVDGPLTGVKRLFPHTSARLEWRCLPLECGFVSLPHLTVTLVGAGDPPAQTSGTGAVGGGVVLVDGEEISNSTVFVAARAR